MKQHVIKYIGAFSGAEAKGVPLLKGVPTPVSRALFESLIAQPDFAESSLAELAEFESASALKSAPAAVKAKETK